jgi:hypothetical protein
VSWRKRGVRLIALVLPPTVVLFIREKLAHHVEDQLPRLIQVKEKIQIADCLTLCLVQM